MKMEKEQLEKVIMSDYRQMNELMLTITIRNVVNEILGVIEDKKIQNKIKELYKFYLDQKNLNKKIVIKNKELI